MEILQKYRLKSTLKLQVSPNLKSFDIILITLRYLSIFLTENSVGKFGEELNQKPLYFFQKSTYFRNFIFLFKVATNKRI